MLGQKFGSGIAALQLRYFVEIAIIQRRQHCLERLMGAADIDNDTVAVERLGGKGRVDNEGRAMQRLRWSEHGAAK